MHFKIGAKEVGCNYASQPDDCKLFNTAGPEMKNYLLLNFLYISTKLIFKINVNI